jgi:outer membrane lipoprotein-sorting protein
VQYKKYRGIDVLAGVSRNLVFVALLLPVIGPLAAQAEPTALQILDRADDKLDIKNSRVNLEMSVYRNNDLRKTYRMLLKYQDADYTLAETVYPPRNEGEKMLQSGRRNYWLFLPNINKTVRISESNSFSNGDFSNSDILAPRLSNEYVPKLLGTEKLRDEEAYKLELVANDESTPYARIVYWVRKSDYFPLRRDYYTFSQQLLKRMDIGVTTKVMNGLPDTLAMSSVLEKDKKTIIRYVKYTANVKYPADTFNENSMMRR